MDQTPHRHDAPPRGRLGPRVHARRDGPRVRGHPRGPRGRRAPDRARGRRPHAPPARFRHGLLPVLQPQQGEPRPRPEGAGGEGDRPPPREDRRRRHRELRPRHDGAARVRVGRALRAQPAARVLRAEGFSLGPLREAPRHGRGRPDDGRPRLHDGPPRPAVARRNVRHRHHGRHVRRHRDPPRAQGARRDGEGLEGEERALRDDGLSHGPAHGLCGAHGRARAADGGARLGVVRVPRLHGQGRPARLRGPHLRQALGAFLRGLRPPGPPCRPPPAHEQRPHQGARVAAARDREAPGRASRATRSSPAARRRTCRSLRSRGRRTCSRTRS